METELPFGAPHNKKKPSFFKPILKELKKRIKKLKTKPFRVLIISTERQKKFLKVAKDIQNWIIKNFLFLKVKIKKLSKPKIIPLFGLREIYELNETKKASIMSNQMIHKVAVKKKKSKGWTNFSLSKNKLKNLISRIKTIRNKTEKISKENLTTSYNKERYDYKIIESSKKSWQALKRKNIRLFRKARLFFKFCIEQLYIAILLGIINIPRITTQFFFESTKRILDKSISIYKNEENGEKKKNKKNTIYFISTLQNLISKKNFFNYDLGSLSQAYVFYKLSQIQVSNFSNLKAILEYKTGITAFFVTKKIKAFFKEQEIFNSELKDKTLFNSEVNNWKNWLRSHSQYNLSPIAWAILVTPKWKNKINQDYLVLNPSFTTKNSYEKKKCDNYKKQNFFEADSLLNPKHNLKKDYIYNLFCYKSINSTEKKIDMSLEKKIDMSLGISRDKRLVSYFIKKYNMRGRGEIQHRKYWDWRILNFLFRKKVNIEPWFDINIKKNYIKTKAQNYQSVDEISLANQKSFFFDWMGMNEEILNHHITNFDFLFFPELLLFSSTYKLKPWIIPIQSLLFNFNETQKVNKTFTLNIPSNEKKSLQLYNLIKKEKVKKEKDSAGQRELEKAKKINPELARLNKKKNIEENDAESKIKKCKTKKQYKNHTEAELDLFLTRYLRFQLRWNRFVNQKMLKNIKIYCLLVRLKNPNEIMISSIERGGINPYILMSKKNCTFANLMKNAMLSIEPVRLSVKNDGHRIIYRTVGISLVHKTKYKISKRYKKKGYIDKKITADFFIPENILSPKRRREFRILICFHLKNKNVRDRNSRFDKNIQNLAAVLHKKKDLDKDQKNLIKLKSFIWPNFRLEDLACMNRFWFNTTNGNNFSMIRIHMYTRFQIN